MDEPFRRSGVGGRLIAEASRRAFIGGTRTLYLCARPILQSYYKRLGWTIIEEGVGRDDLTVFVLRASTKDRGKI